MVAIADMLSSGTVIRPDGRAVDELRPVRITRGWTQAPEGSVLIECGNTRVLCTASFTPTLPRWRKDSGLGWVTAEYAMLPRATSDRTARESVRGKVGGRTQEISRLIGRCLRGVVNMKALGENQVQIDCDVLQADGGTRTASVTGAYIALADALAWAEGKGHIKSAEKALTSQVSAVSVGIIDGKPMLDLPYVEDSRAMTDMNVAMTGTGDFIEIQGTAEHQPFNREELGTLLDLATKGNKELQALQRKALSSEMGHIVSSEQAKDKE
ncbi:ribonuclease PH [Bombiscardovia nodaiensis]|uniref:Ribonuclease PH n=1 Tax=Bombiscardovia nodaiensis TaxID=2932181 RepID=A0ABN6SDC7_9BIFI|nr:ribonuclease PH [Bombiscardovia nodaiensis]